MQVCVEPGAGRLTAYVDGRPAAAASGLDPAGLRLGPRLVVLGGGKVLFMHTCIHTHTHNIYIWELNRLVVLGGVKVLYMHTYIHTYIYRLNRLVVLGGVFAILCSRTYAIRLDLSI